MPEVPHDATVALRLELGRMTDKANSLEAALRKEVMAVIREEIAKAQPKKMYDTKPDGTICIVAEDEEIAALKADVEHVKFWNGQLKAENDRLRSQFANSEQDNARLKAEVERLKAEKDQAECDYDNCQRRKVSIDNHRFDLFTENKNLKAEVERLRASSFVTAVPVEQYMRVIKAGDAMCRVMVSHHGKVGVVDDWNDAKEGKPSV